MAAPISGTTVTYTPAAGYSGGDSFTGMRQTVAAPLQMPPCRSASAPLCCLSYRRRARCGCDRRQRMVAAPFSVRRHGALYGPAPRYLPGSCLTRRRALCPARLLPRKLPLPVTATDAHGATGSASYTLNVSAASPVASDSVATVAANTSSNPVALSLSGGAATSVSIVDMPAHGSAVVSGTVVSYTPVPGYSGSDSFTYTATNGSGIRQRPCLTHRDADTADAVTCRWRAARGNNGQQLETDG